MENTENTEKLVDQLCEFIAAPQVEATLGQLPEELRDFVREESLALTKKILMDQLSTAEVAFLWEYHKSDVGKKVTDLSTRIQLATLRELPAMFGRLFEHVQQQQSL